VRRLRALGATMLVCSGAAAPLLAASPGVSGPAGRVELGAGLLCTGAIALGSQSASERSPGGAPFALFQTSTDLASAAGAEARIGVALTRVLQVEVTGSFMRPEMQTAVRADAEGAPPVVATGQTTQVTLEGGLVVQLARLQIGRHAVPFLSGGAGYLRQVHRTNGDAQNGSTYRAGIGVKWWRNSPAHARLKAFGLSAEGRVVARHGGVALDGATHLSPGFSASVFVRL
jgi:hypothetical protein